MNACAVQDFLFPKISPFSDDRVEPYKEYTDPQSEVAYKPART